MRVRSPALIIAFANVTEALAVERYCQEASLPGRIIPVPREVTAGCGLAWKAAPEEAREQIKAAHDKRAAELTAAAQPAEKPKEE